MTTTGWLVFLAAMIGSIIIFVFARYGPAFGAIILFGACLFGAGIVVKALTK